jgi:hypothetical protein
MVFLLFVASVAVLEYLVRRPPGTDTPNDPQPPWKERVSKVRTDPGQASAPDLARLGQALDNYGRGRTPSTTSEAPEVRGSTADRV